MKNKKQTNIIMTCILATILPACQKFIDAGTPSQQISSIKVFADDNTALSAVLGVYTTMRQSIRTLANGGVSTYCGLSADELYPATGNTAYMPFYNNSLKSNNSAVLTAFWSGPYSIIYQTNAIVEGIQHSSGLNQTEADRKTGEMKLVRAFYYFYLVNFFGDIPLVTTTDYKVNEVLPRTASDSVFHTVTEDLNEAVTLLPESYPDGYGKTRPNKAAARTLLARVDLFRKEYGDAEKQASLVIGDAGYFLMEKLSDVFTIGSSETIWEIAPPGGTANTAEGATFVPSSGSSIPALTLMQPLLNDFEVGDGRYSAWISNNTIRGTTYYYPSKYKQRSNASITEYDVVFRLAEIYLIRAEARLALGKMDGALSDLNAIRKRASLDTLPHDREHLSKDMLIDELRHQRRDELFAEWGNRWLDLKRWNIADSVLSTAKGRNWSSSASLYPIPIQELIRNTNLTQNPGY